MRLVTYNIRKGKGADGRSSVPMQQIGQALRGHDVDLLMCQEVFHCGRTGRSQTAHLANSMALEAYYGANKLRAVGHHGNAIFTRLAVQRFENHDISTNRIERRGALYARLKAGSQPLHVFNVHLGLNQRQRRLQVAQVYELVGHHCGPGEPVVLAGDFNDWNGRLDRLVVEELGFENVFADYAADIRTWHARRPVFSLDRIYLKNLKPTEVGRFGGAPWSELSDHLPLWAVLDI